MIHSNAIFSSVFYQLWHRLFICLFFIFYPRTFFFTFYRGHFPTNLINFHFKIWHLIYIKNIKGLWTSRDEDINISKLLLLQCKKTARWWGKLKHRLFKCCTCIAVINILNWRAGQNELLSLSRSWCCPACLAVVRFSGFSVALVFGLAGRGGEGRVRRDSVSSRASQWISPFLPPLHLLKLPGAGGCCTKPMPLWWETGSQGVDDEKEK